VLPLLGHVIGILIKVQDLSKLVHYFSLSAPVNEMAQQETNATALHAISDLDCLDCLILLAVHFNHHKVALDQIAHINMSTTHLVDFTGTTAFPACDPNNVTIPCHPIVDC
jgi:hypothetical protein